MGQAFISQRTCEQTVLSARKCKPRSGERPSVKFSDRGRGLALLVFSWLSVLACSSRMYFPLAIQVSPELAIGPAYVILEEGQTLNRVTLAQERPLCSLETARLPVRSCVALPSYWLSPLPAFLVRYSPKRSLQCPKPISTRATRHRQGEYSSLSTQEATCRRPSTRPCRATRSCSRPARPSPEISRCPIKREPAGSTSSPPPTPASRPRARASRPPKPASCPRS